MRTIVARRITAAVAISIAMAATGCSPIQLDTSPLVPGSQWQVVSVDDESTIGLELILTFIGNSATLSSRCGASSGDVVVDAEGHDVTFGALQGPAGQPACPAAALALHQRVAAALQGVERWESAGDTTELHGERIIRLRSQATDT
jgi:heat shock protein HslJ